jgi:hypothetical protein
VFKPFVEALIVKFNEGDIDSWEFERQLAMADDWDENGNPRFVEE